MATFTSGIVDFEKVRFPAGARTWVRDRRVESTAHAGYVVANTFGRHFEVDYTNGAVVVVVMVMRKTVDAWRT